MPSSKRPHAWDAFLKDLDAAVNDTVRLDCIGGFVVTQFYGLGRPTADVDVIEIAPSEAAETVTAIGMRGGSFSRPLAIVLARRASAPSMREENRSRMAFSFSFRAAVRHRT